MTDNKKSGVFNELTMILKNINQQEWHFVLLISLITVLITILPYFCIWLATPPNMIYLGTHSLTPADTYVYFSYVEQAKQGHILFKDLYSSELQQRNIFIPYFLIFGWIANLTGLSNPLLHQLVRLILIIIFVPILYYFITLFINEVKWRKISLIFTLFASGVSVYFLKFFLSLYNISKEMLPPMDLWAPESSIFLTIYHNPLYVLALIFIVLTFIFATIAFESKKMIYAYLAGATSFLLFINHPYHPPTIYGVIGGYTLFLLIKFRTQKIKNILIYFTIIIISLLPIIYYLHLISIDPIMRYKMTIQPSPIFPLTMMSYGLPFIFALIGSWLIVTKRVRNQTEIKQNYLPFLIIWFILVFALLQCSFLRHPRRLSLGLLIPISLLTIIFFIYLLTTIRKQKWLGLRSLPAKIILFVLFIMFFCFSGLYIVYRDLRLAMFSSQYVYTSKDAFEGMKWLKRINENSIILAPYQVGNLIPGISGRTVYIGHNPETAFFEEKLKQAEIFFNTNGGDLKKKMFLKNNNIEYVFFPTTLLPPSIFHPEEKDYLQRIFENKEIKIFKVLN